MDLDQPDEADLGGPVAVGAMLGVLRSVGLVGPKLALQVGAEEAVASQVAERDGVPYGEWAKRLIEAQVRDAMTSMELDKRIAGGAALPGVQSVQDAMASAEKEKNEKKEEAKKKRSLPTPVVIPPRGKMLKLTRPAKSMARLMEDGGAKMIRLLMDELELVNAPIMEHLGRVADPERQRWVF